jgi:transposase
VAIGKWGRGERLKHSKFTLLKLPRNRTEKQALKLRELLRNNLRSVKDCLMRDDFQRFWEYERSSWASTFLDQWCERAMQSNIKPMKEMMGTFRRHRRLLLN